MTGKKLQPNAAELWAVARRQHGVVTRAQLLAHGFSGAAVEHRLANGRLHRLWRGVYAVGRAEVSQRGRWMAAALACGPDALLSHRNAGVMWGLLRDAKSIHVTVPCRQYRRRPGIRVHRRVDLSLQHRRWIDGIPVTDLVSTFVDLASCLADGQLERAVNEADRLDLIDPEFLRAAVEPLSRRPGLARLRAILDRHTFTDSGLERRFLELVRATGMPSPETQVEVNGFRVDFFWRELGLVVETDGLRYHRTPAQQARDQRRDQAHAAAGLTTIRFAEVQVRNEPESVQATLAIVAGRLSRSIGG
jgi:very-short-patch-repair endonuclease/predicted transcriptional regulator of viral defense system